MNYRHIYHAGNFADIFKHITLTLIIGYLQRKPAAFRLIDTHAGCGLYDLSAAEAGKTAEWQSGLLRFLAALSPALAAGHLQDYAALAAGLGRQGELLAPYLAALAAANPAGTIRIYPGSPWLGRRLLRKQDRLTAIELHPQDYARLKQCFSGDYQSRILHLDGRLALKAQLPPKEKRGLVLIDPPYEAADEFAALKDGLRHALRRFAYGSYMLWYPVKNYAAVQDFSRWLAENGSGGILQAELRIRQKSALPQLDGSGLILINPPYILSEQLTLLEPLLLRAFAQDTHACLRQTWLRRP